MGDNFIIGNLHLAVNSKHNKLLAKGTTYRYPKPINCKYFTGISGRLNTIFGANRVREKY